MRPGLFRHINTSLHSSSTKKEIIKSRTELAIREINALECYPTQVRGPLDSNVIPAEKEQIPQT